MLIFNRAILVANIAYWHLEIELILQCPIWLNRLKDPCALPCQPVLCYSEFSYNDLLDLNPIKRDMKERCSKYAQLSLLNFCGDCDYYLYGKTEFKQIVVCSSIEIFYLTNPEIRIEENQKMMMMRTLFILQLFPRKGK